MVEPPAVAGLNAFTLRRPGGQDKRTFRVPGRVGRRSPRRSGGGSTELLGSPVGLRGWPRGDNDSMEWIMG